jgi:hypothetical protein
VPAKAHKGYFRGQEVTSFFVRYRTDFPRTEECIPRILGDRAWPMFMSCAEEH